MNGQPESRFHGKVRVQIGETLIEVNVFGDNREMVYLEIQQAIAQFSRDIKPATAAGREIARAEQARAAAAPSRVQKPTATSTKAANPPVCGECDLADRVELIAWIDKLTGEQRREWKCQRCKEWVFPKKKKAVEELQF